MGLKNNYLEEITSTIGNANLVNYLAFSEEPQQTGANITTFTDEVGDRISLSQSVAGRAITLSGIRTAASVVDTAEGDKLEALGWFPDESGGVVKIVRNLPNVTHTENFDIEVVLDLTVRRRT